MVVLPSSGPRHPASPAAPDPQPHPGTHPQPPPAGNKQRFLLPSKHKNYMHHSPPFPAPAKCLQLLLWHMSPLWPPSGYFQFQFIFVQLLRGTRSPRRPLYDEAPQESHSSNTQLMQFSSWLVHNALDKILIGEGDAPRIRSSWVCRAVHNMQGAIPLILDQHSRRGICFKLRKFLFPRFYGIH